jgi:hypothetical protein
MSLRHRLARLEQHASRITAAQPHQSPEYQEQYDAWLAGEGPRPAEPPCPPWTDPEAWASQMRVNRGIGMWFRGELGTGAYAEGTTAAEAKLIAGFVEAFGHFQADVELAGLVPAAGPDNVPGP